VDQFDIVRQQAGEAVAGNGVGVAAAELHQPVLPPGSTSADVRGHATGDVATAEFVYILHACSPAANWSIKARVRAASSGSSLPMA
jgi:uncharacterized cupin superfamily protein